MRAVKGFIMLSGSLEGKGKFGPTHNEQGNLYKENYTCLTRTNKSDPYKHGIHDILESGKLYSGDDQMYIKGYKAHE